MPERERHRTDSKDRNDKVDQDDGDDALRNLEDYDGEDGGRDRRSRSKDVRTNLKDYDSRNGDTSRSRNYTGGRMPRGVREVRQKDRIPSIFDDMVHLTEKVYAPVSDYPGFNFGGQLFGIKGQNIKKIVQSTRARITILGRGSTKDSAQEEELLETGLPEHAHFAEGLHVIIFVKGSRIDAHRRMAAALKDVCYWLVPRPDNRPTTLDYRLRPNGYTPTDPKEIEDQAKRLEEESRKLKMARGES